MTETDFNELTVKTSDNITLIRFKFQTISNNTIVDITIQKFLRTVWKMIMYHDIDSV